MVSRESFPLCRVGKEGLDFSRRKERLRCAVQADRFRIELYELVTPPARLDTAGHDVPVVIAAPHKIVERKTFLVLSLHTHGAK